MKFAALTAAALLTLATTANAAVNLVSNGGFETGDLTGWGTLSADVPLINGSFPNTGSYSAIFETEDFAVIQQYIATIPGHTYRIEYYLASPEEEGDFNAEWDGDPIPGAAIHGEAFPYTLFSFDMFAPNSTEELIFAGRNLDSYFLDDISVIDLDAVPEPASLSLLAVGTLALLRRKRM